MGKPRTPRRQDAERPSTPEPAGGSFSPETYRAVFNASPDGIVLVDEGGVIREVNAAAEEMFGYARGELVGLTIEALVPDSLRPAHLDHRRRFLADPGPRPMGIGMELRGRRQDGSDIPLEISLSPVSDAAGVRLVIATARDVTQRKRMRNFSAGALRATEEERQRVARDLHDDTAQRLAGLLVRLRLLELSPEDARADRFQELREEIVATVESVRQVARALRPPELQDAGIGPALHAYVRTLKERSGLDVEMDVESIDQLLAPDSQLVLYRVVQEALSNVIRHSGASGALVQVRRDGRFVTASVQDAGCGFRLGAVESREGGLGIVGMRERAVMVGGHLTIESNPGEGTRVLVRIPLSFADEVQRG